MSKILFAWEFGENWGHLSRDLSIARRLQETKHEVIFAVSDTKVATEVLGPAGIPFVQAPLSRRVVGISQPVASHAEMLIAAGYGEWETLHGLVSAWRGLFELVRPEVMVIDYAPTALLAARTQNIPVVLVGSGFELPPDLSPLPSFRTWENVPTKRLELAETLALRNTNAVLAGYSASPFARFAELFQSQHKILTTFAELDHYGPRPDQHYAGPVYDLPRARKVEWRAGLDGPRIFAYLRPWVPNVDALLGALGASGAQVVCAFPGATRAQLERSQAPGLRILPEAVALEYLLPTADLVIGYGAGTIASTLLAGVPMMLVPLHSEQYLSALRVETLGAGVVVRGKPSQATYAETISNALDRPALRDAAGSFAEKYRGFDPARTAALIATTVQSVLQ